MERLKHILHHSDRPNQVSYAVAILYLTIIISAFVYLVQVVFYWISSTEPVDFNYWIIILTVTAISYLIEWFIASKIAAGKNWARWLLLLGFGLSLVVVTCNIRSVLSGTAISGMFILGQLLVTAIAVGLLFQRSNNQWFTGKEVPVLEKSSTETESISSEFRRKIDETIHTGTPQKRKTGRWLIGSILVVTLLLIPWCALALFASMIGWPVVIQEEGGWTLGWAVFTALLCFPVYSIPLLAIAWQFNKKERYRAVVITALTPLIIAMLSFLLWVLAS